MKRFPILNDEDLNVSHIKQTYITVMKTLRLKVLIPKLVRGKSARRLDSGRVWYGERRRTSLERMKNENVGAK